MISRFSTKIVRNMMSSHEKFLFDLNGFIILSNVLSPEEVQSMNSAIDHHQDKIKARELSELKNTKSGTALSAPGSRNDLGNILDGYKLTILA